MAVQGQSRPQRRICKRMVLFACVWVAANYAIIWSLDLYDDSVAASEAKVPLKVLRRFEARVFRLGAASDNAGVSLAYRFRPPSVWDSEQSAPLLVFLHGSGQRGYDNVQQLKAAPSVMCESQLVVRYPCAMLVPQCPGKCNWTSPVSSKHDMTDVLLEMIDDVLRDQRIDPRRVYLVGTSMGGFGVWRVAARAPRRFAAVVPIAGGASEDIADSLVDVPIWAVHSIDDESVPVKHTQQIIAAIRERGGNPRFLELTNAGHGAWRDVFQDGSPVLDWMFQQRRAIESE